MRIRTLPLPDTPDRPGNFALVVDRLTPEQAAVFPVACHGLGRDIGASVVLVYSGDVALPEVDPPADTPAPTACNGVECYVCGEAGCPGAVV